MHIARLNISPILSQKTEGDHIPPGIGPWRPYKKRNEGKAIRFEWLDIKVQFTVPGLNFEVMHRNRHLRRPGHLIGQTIVIAVVVFLGIEWGDSIMQSCNDPTYITRSPTREDIIGSVGSRATRSPYSCTHGQQEKQIENTGLHSGFFASFLLINYNL